LPKTFEDQYDPLARNALAEVVWGLGETSQTLLAGILTILTLWPWYYTVGERYYEGCAVKGNFVWDQAGFMIGLKIMPSLKITILFDAFALLSYVRFADTTGISGWGLRKWAKMVLAHMFSYQITTPKTLVTDGPYAYLVHPGNTLNIEFATSNFKLKTIPF
jgi:hypothetical protein